MQVEKEFGWRRGARRMGARREGVEGSARRKGDEVEKKCEQGRGASREVVRVGKE